MNLPNTLLRSLFLAGGLVGFVLPGFSHAAILGTDEFAQLDANKDGVVSAAENAAGTRAVFRQADANRDDVLTVTELAVAEERKADREARDTATATPRKSASSGLRDAAEQIKVVDENGDGEASSAELVAGAQQRFALMDVNHDGYLDPAECEAGASS